MFSSLHFRSFIFFIFTSLHFRSFIFFIFTFVPFLLLSLVIEISFNFLIRMGDGVFFLNIRHR